MTHDIAYMGEFLRTYHPPRNAHTAINSVLSRSSINAIVTMEVEFPDISFWQGEVDYEIMSAKTDAVILRAGQNLWADKQFERNYTESKKNGLRVGVYWFYDGRASPGEQAKLLISLLRDKKLELEVFMDWEHNYGGAHEGLRNVVAMMEVIESAGLDIKGVGLYTGYYFFRANSNPIANLTHYNYLKNKPLWLAWYSTSPSSVLIPAPWDSMTIWQWGTPSVQWGQQSAELDMNFFNGTQQEFDLRYNTNGEPEPMADYIRLTPNTSVTRSIRAGTAYPQVPHIVGNRIGQINIGGTAKANPSDRYVYASNITYTDPSGVVRQASQGDIWWKVYEANGQPIEGWVAEKHLGQTLLNVELIAEPVPTPPLPDLPVTIILGDDVVYQKQTVNIVLKPK